MIENVLLLKLIHVVSAAVLFGTGLGVAYFMLMAYRTRDAFIVANTAGMAVIADAVFVANAAIIQPVTGVQLALAIGYSLWEPWIAVTFALYLVIVACWLPVLWLQVRMRNIARVAAEEGTDLPARYHRLFRAWFVLGWPAFISMIAIFALMTFKPSLW
ncbi:MAG: DUF2269 domain-containing protein [Xanthobacteraceae bacterium]|nr:DUF2269 domain-containing protein [Xanthobacteraceae bacterium]